MEVDGKSVPRVFVSALSGDGLPELRAWLAAEVARRQAPMAGQDPLQTAEAADPLP
jgi:GTP-binding protein HflX